MGIWLLCFVVFLICVVLGLWVIGPQTHHKKDEKKGEPQEKTESKVKQSKQPKKQEESSLKEKDETTTEKASKKKKKKKDQTKQAEATAETATAAALNSQADETYLGHLKTPGIVAIDIKLSRILVSCPNKELTLFDMKNYSKENPGNCKKGYVLLDDVASAVAIGDKHYFAASEYQRTISYYEYVGQNGVYFKLVDKFKNKYLHKEPIMAMHVNDRESCIVTVGNMSDTFIKVWNLRGEKLAEVNTSQVEHYQANFGENYLMLRSWNTELKIYHIVYAKDSKEFSKIEKGAQLSHQGGVLAGSCDQKGETAVSLRKDRTINLWTVDIKSHTSKVKKIVDHVKFGHGDVSVCSIHSIENEQGTLNSIVALSDGNNVVICDWETFDVLKQIKSPYGGKDTVSAIKFIGKKSVVMYVLSNKQGKILLWNVSSLMTKATAH